MRFKLFNFIFLFFFFNLAFSNDLANPFLANYSISVTASSNTNYTLSGTDFNGTVSGNDPSLTFIVGDQITFNVNASGHPFYLKTVAGSGDGNQISGVTNQGTTNGAVVWTPAAAGTYYYQCGPHTAMVGTITIIKSISVSTFNNAGGDNLWSTAANWSAGIPNVDTAKVIVDSDLTVDSSVTVAQIKMSNASSDASVTITATNSSVLTVTGAGVTQPIQNNKTASSFIFDLPVVFDSAGETETLRLNSGGDQQITFLSSLTLNDELTVSGKNKLHDLNLDGSLLGAGNLKFGSKAQANFGASYDGSSHTGDIIVAGTGTDNDNLITSNVSDDGTLLASGNKIDVQGAGAKIIVNGANTLNGNITIGDNDPTLTVNANQSAIGTITMGAGTLNLALAADVTSAAFVDNSSADWGTGSLVITGAANNVVSFGTDANGITAAQLAQITISDGGAVINASGQISAATSSALVTTFNNAGGDNLWSNSANWSNGIPTDNNSKVTVDADLIVDSSVTVGQIKNASATSADSVTITATNSSVLTVTGAGVTQPIQNNKKSSSLIFNLPVVFDSEGETEAMKINSGGDESSGFANITFSSSLTLNDELTVSGENKNHDLNLNGSLLGAGNLKFGANTQANFGTSYDGSSHTGDVIASGVVTVVSNVSDDGTLLASGNQIDVQANGATITINGANTLKGNIKIGDYKPTLTVNANQSAIGTITMGSGTLNLTLATDVTSAAFADNSSADWGTGLLVIVGAGNNEVSFGTDENGITAAQLSQITLNGSTPDINSSGQISTSSIAISTFNNAGGDNLWSNAANWSAGIPNIDTANVTVETDLIVDSSVTIAQIKNKGTTSDASVTITAINDAILTVTGAGVTQPIQNNKKSSSLIFNLPVVFDSDGGTETIKINVGGDESSGFANITFSSSLTLNDELTVSGSNLNHDLNLNGSLLGAGNLKFGSKAQANFGASYDGSSHTGDVIAAGAAENSLVTIVSNVSDDGTLLASGNSIDVQATGVIINVNGANTLKGNIKIGDYKSTLTVNANQSAVGTITMGAGTLTLTVPESLTSLAFADNSSADWGTGSLVITGAGNNEISFGTTADGVTATQLAQITFNGSTPVINASGQISTSSISVSTFNNDGGDNLWSNASNWSAGIPNVDTAKVTVDSDLIVDSSVTVGQIKISNATSDASVTITAINDAILTVTGAGVTQPIQNNKSASSFIFNLPVVFDSEGGTETLRLNSGGDQQTTFLSSLTLNDELTVSGVNKLHDLNLNGSLLGAGNLKFGNKVQANFGADYDGSSHTGKIIVAGTGTNNDNLITSNVSDDGTLLASGNQIDVQGAGAKIIINGANTLKGNIAVGDSDPTLTINKNQSALGTITMGTGTLNLALAADVTSVAFADNSSADWGTGKVVITGAADNEVSFGTTAAGITAAQLAQITLDGSTSYINSSGQISTSSLFNLPPTNNKVSVTSASCIGTTDGSIGLSIEDASYNYTVTVTGQDDPITLGGETKTASVTGLGTGTYTVCFKVDGQDTYEQCFEVNIGEPKALSVFIDVDNDNRTTSIQLSGSSSYNVEVNGQRYNVKGDRFTTNLPSGLSIIKISTDLDCQGIIEREIFISEDILYYPNPTPGDVNVYVNGEDSKVTMSVFSSKGDLIFTKEQEIQTTRKTDLDLGGVPAGTYLVTLEGPTVRKTFKIVKR